MANSKFNPKEGKVMRLTECAKRGMPEIVRLTLENAINERAVVEIPSSHIDDVTIEGLCELIFLDEGNPINNLYADAASYSFEEEPFTTTYFRDGVIETRDTLLFELMEEECFDNPVRIALCYPEEEFVINLDGGVAGADEIRLRK